MTVRVGDVAYLRSGDKGDIANVAVIPRDEADYEWLGREVTVERVAEAFGPIVRGRIVRYEVPGIRAYNFVLEEALHGGVARSLNLDVHGKSGPRSWRRSRWASDERGRGPGVRHQRAVRG
jgi:hypothetical protein